MDDATRLALHTLADRIGQALDRGLDLQYIAEAAERDLHDLAEDLPADNLWTLMREMT